MGPSWELGLGPFIIFERHTLGLRAARLNLPPWALVGALLRFFASYHEKPSIGP